MAVRSRAEVMAERKAQAGAGAAGGTAKCPSCKTSQKPPPDGLCMACGVDLTGEAKTQPDPAMLRPDSAETKAAMAIGALVHAMKQQGFDVTLKDAESWTPAAIASYEELVKVGVEKHGIPVLLQDKFVGKGKVPGATKPERDLGGTDAGLLSRSLGKGTQKRLVAIWDSSPISVRDRTPDPLGDPSPLDSSSGPTSVSSSSAPPAAATPTSTVSAAPEADPRQTPVEGFIATKHDKQPLGGDLTPMTDLLQMLHQLGATDITLPDLGKWEPALRRQAFEVCEKAIKQGRRVRVDMDADRKLTLIRAEIDVDAEEEVGSTVTVTWGEEKYTPIPGSYSTLTIGSFTMTATVHEGETRCGVMTRLHREMEEIADMIKAARIPKFVAKLKEVVAEAKGK